MTKAKVTQHDRVTLAVVGKLDNGALFYEVTPQEPLVVELGDNQLPPSVETALIGMGVGETRKIRIDPDEGYGPRLKDLLHEVPRPTIEKRFNPKSGMVISQQVERDGKKCIVPATIIEVNEETVVIDYNHPLAGHHLTYELTVLAVEEPA
jgi:FKBP-type peptidyl-prolyl cis-trans isomerase 2